MHQHTFGGRAPPPDPLGELIRFPRPHSCNGGPTSKGRGRGPAYKGREVRGRGLLVRVTEGREGRRERTEREGKGTPIQSQAE